MVGLIARLALSIAFKLQHIVASAARKGIGAGAAAQMVVIIAAIKRIVAAAAIDGVIATATGHGVVATPGRNRVIAANGIKIVVAIASRQGVVPRRSGILHPVKLVGAKLVKRNTLQGYRAALRQGDNRIPGIIAAQKRLQFAPGGNVAVGQRNHILARGEIGYDIMVSAIGKDECVIASPARKHIVTRPAIKGIVASIARQNIVPGATGHHVIACTTVKAVGPGIAG